MCIWSSTSNGEEDIGLEPKRDLIRASLTVKNSLWAKCLELQCFQAFRLERKFKQNIKQTFLFPYPFPLSPLRCFEGYTKSSILPLDVSQHLSPSPLFVSSPSPLKNLPFAQRGSLKRESVISLGDGGRLKCCLPLHS